MSRAAMALLRDKADWEWLISGVCPLTAPFFADTYEQALRDQALAIIGRGC